jgi:hypothetical protein
LEVVTWEPTKQIGGEVFQTNEQLNYTAVEACKIENYGLIAIPREFRCTEKGFINTFRE